MTRNSNLRKIAVLLDAGRPAFGFQASNADNRLASDLQTNLQACVNELHIMGFEVFVVQGFSNVPISGATLVRNLNWSQSGPIQSFALAIEELRLDRLQDHTLEIEALVLYGDSLPASQELNEFINGIKAHADATFLAVGSKVLKTSIGVGTFLQVAEEVKIEMGEGRICSIPTNGPFLLRGQVVLRLLEINNQEGSSLQFMGEALSALYGEGWKVQGASAQASEDSARLEISVGGSFAFGSKAETLASISQVHRAGLVPNFSVFSRTSWERDAQSLIRSVLKGHSGSKYLAIRSSFEAEDLGNGGSNAGKFESILDVLAEDEGAVFEAVEKVFDSNPNPSLLDQVLIQDQVLKTKAAGVVTTRNYLGAAYFNVNLSRGEGDTDSVTSGAGSSHEEFVCKSDLSMIDWRGTPEYMQEICALAEEVRALTAHDSLDLEFAIDSSGQIKLFQVRRFNAPVLSADEMKFQSQQVALASLSFPRSKVCPCPDGTHDLYALMPDWNPAEIIGKKPRQLARSLYGYVVTNHVWSDQRAQYGYYRVDHPLLRDFLGTPAVDVHSSFLSFVPNFIDESLALRIVASAKETLRENPASHDKVEFEVMPTCFDSSFDRWRAGTLRSEKFTEIEFERIKQAYSEITREAILRRLRSLPANGSSFFDWPSGGVSPTDSVVENLKKAHEGALTFAHYARDAFVAISLLMGHAGGNTHGKVVERFVGSLSTVSSQFVRDCRLAKEGKLGQEDLVSKYGHLRSGTYDILNPTFGSNPDFFFSPPASASGKQREDSSHSAAEISASLARELELSGLHFDSSGIHLFLKAAIEGRESTKLAFTRHLSRAIDGIEEWGAQNRISREELSHLPLETLFEVLPYENLSPASRESLLTQSSRNAEQHKLNTSLEVPLIISSGQDLLRYKEIASAPNFSGSRSVFAKRAILSGHELAESESIEGKIVLIESADPGFDWIFSKAPAGLVTLFGGRNSHMAIRCMELDLPAAIGVGESKFEKLLQQETINLDPVSRTVT